MPGASELIEKIHRVIEPVDVAGLGDRSRRNWFPVEAEDLLAARDAEARRVIRVSKAAWAKRAEACP